MIVTPLRSICDSFSATTPGVVWIVATGSRYICMRRMVVGAGERLKGNCLFRADSSMSPTKTLELYARSALARYISFIKASVSWEVSLKFAAILWAFSTTLSEEITQPFLGCVK